ncbi:MAG: AAA family ATPase, partial [Bacteroidales bacterium]|nr:AAA family ATPase [Bacteroidales bacterium]
MDYIEITGYKSIKHQKVEFRNINILIGANGSGKSNFISFFEFLKELQNGNLQNHIELKGGEDKMLHNGRKITDTLQFKVEFEQGQNGYDVILKAGDNGFIFTKERLIYQQDRGYDVHSSNREANLKNRGDYRADFIRKYLKGLRKYHFHDTGSNSPFTKMSHTENDIFYLYEKGDNLAAFLYH